jgi:phage terminase large subunit-like protein
MKQVWYDPSYFYNAPALQHEGLPLVEVQPTRLQMAPLALHCYEAIRRTRVTHDDDETFNSHVLNARRSYGANGFVLEKVHYGHKIDAAIALILCYGAATQFAEPKPPNSSFRIK